jgi:predicted enzyme related to lactoylglutathione lyase
MPGTRPDPATAGHGVSLWFHDPDGSALHAGLVDAGVEIAAAPVDGPFGFTFTFVDPDGYRITVHDRRSAA